MGKNRFNSILDTIERVGNKLPHPATLFFLMAVLVAVISAIGAGFELSAVCVSQQAFNGVLQQVSV